MQLKKLCSSREKIARIDNTEDIACSRAVKRKPLELRKRSWDRRATMVPCACDFGKKSPTLTRICDTGSVVQIHQKGKRLQSFTRALHRSSHAAGAAVSAFVFDRLPCGWVGFCSCKRHDSFSQEPCQFEHLSNEATFYPSSWFPCHNCEISTKDGSPWFVVWCMFQSILVLQEDVWSPKKRKRRRNKASGDLSHEQVEPCCKVNQTASGCQ